MRKEIIDLLQKQRPRDAIDLIKSSSDLSDTDKLNFLSTALFLDKQFSDALSLLLKMKENDDTTKIRLKISECYFQISDLQNCMVELDYVRNNSNSLDELILVAKKYTDLSEYSKSKAVYTQLLNTAQNNPNIIRGLVDCYVKLNDFDNAYKHSLHLVKRSLVQALDLKILISIAEKLGKLRDVEEVIDDLLLGVNRHNLLDIYAWYKEKLGEEYSALKIYIEILKNKTDDEFLWRLANLLKNKRLDKVQVPDELSEILVSVIKTPGICNPTNIIHAITDVIRNSLKSVSQSNQVSNIEPTDHLLQFLEQDELINITLRTSVIACLNLEHMFVSVRRALLLRQNIFSYNSLALSIQKNCEINDYIWRVTETEINELIELLHALQNDTKITRQNEIKLKLKMYLPSHLVDQLILINDKRNLKNELLSQIKNGMCQRPEKTLSQALRAKTQIETKFQYETYPYPKWMSTTIRIEPVPLVKELHLRNIRFDSQLFNCQQNTFEYLVAGCGTGQQSISVAAKYPRASITAIDFSEKSLLYAMKKSEEFKIKNITHRLADLTVSFDEYVNKFDVIECVGVLHHIKDREKALSHLIRYLRRGGLIKIGVYSKVARSEITRLQRLFKGADKHKYLENREQIITRYHADAITVINSPDFYSLSGIKDLLFNEYEELFTIDTLLALVKSTGCSFVGFDNYKLTKLFLKEFDVADLLNLSKWALFEEKYPKAFSQMYEFWLQKP